ncbi:MAG: TolC family protein [Acidobacteria bacterium]|nr:TolC family protein [Acidobacteriota bacterium]
MNRLGRLVTRVIFVTVVVALPIVASAQATAPSPTTAEKARMLELVTYARETFDSAQAQAAQAAAPKKSLEERALARPVLQLKVDDAVRMALDNNIELTVERLNPKLQDMSLAQVKAFYRPVLGATVNANSNAPLPTSLLNGGTNVTNQVSNLNTNITQALPWNGSSFTAAWNNSRTNTTSTFATLNPQWTAQITGTFNQPLWRNFKIDNNRQSLQTTEITRAISDVTLKARIINTIASTRNAYWDLVASIRAIGAAHNKVRVEVGTLTPMDIISAQAEAATRRQTLTVAEATRRTAELVLKRLIVGSTEDALWKATIDPTDINEVQPTPINLESAVTAALGQRTDLVTARKNLESSDVNIRYLQNQMHPALDAIATLGTRGLGGNQFIRSGTEVVGTIPGGWADAMQMLSKFDYPNWLVGVVFSYPLGNSSQKIAYARAKVQYQQSQTQLRGLELTVATEVTNAALQVESTLRRVDAARAARQLAEKRLENEQSKFDVGMSTNFFVVQAQRDLLDSQITELRAALDYRKALVEFERVQEASK